MKTRLLNIPAALALFAALNFTACDVHEWPKEPDTVPVYLQLLFDTEMTEQYWDYADGKLTQSTATTRAAGSHDMRYVVRAFPVVNGKVSTVATREFVFSKNISYFGNDYDYRTTEALELPEGEYKLMAWADFVEPGSTAHKYYNCDSFSEILLHQHKANTDYRDAFRGMQEATLDAVIYEQEPQTITIQMNRPMGKYTFLTTDLAEFIDKEARILRMKAQMNGEEWPDTKTEVDTKGDTKVDTKGVDLDSYRVVFTYPLYMPNKYNMFDDINAGSAQNISFESKLTVLNENEATMGFDYVLANADDPKVTVKLELRDSENNKIAEMQAINVPLGRDVNTIVRGKFLMLDAQGGVSIDPSFDDDYNIVIP